MCFGVSLDPKTIHWNSKRAENLLIQDFFMDPNILSCLRQCLHYSTFGAIDAEKVKILETLTQNCDRVGSIEPKIEIFSQGIDKPLVEVQSPSPSLG